MKFKYYRKSSSPHKTTNAMKATKLLMFELPKYIFVPALLVYIPSQLIFYLHEDILHPHPAKGYL